MAQTTSRRCIQPSATDTVTNTTSETAFAKTLKIPARELKSSFMLKFGAAVKATATNSTDTFRVRAYLGVNKDASGVLIADTGAVDPANNDVAAFDGWAFVVTNGGGGTAVVAGKSDAVQKATAASLPFDQSKTELDLLKDLYLTVTCTQSVASAGNVARLDALWAEINVYDPQL